MENQTTTETVRAQRQYSSESIGKLAEALAKAQGEIEHAAKVADNPFFKSKYADLPAIYDVSRKALAGNGLAVVQATDIESDGSVMLVTTLMHSSGEWTRSWYPVKPVKNDPQGLGSAMTYSRRYTYSAIVGVAAMNEDDDGNAASGRAEGGRPSVFANAALRNKFCDNVITSFNEADSEKALSTLATLNEKKFEELDASGNEHDKLAVEELRKRYKARLIALREPKTVEGELGERARAHAG